ncbi:hypothetical protein E5S70_13220 [Ensifer adhaerens]|uniref:FkbM family methyltransferase n=1 Tax=Ensifer canadensis TaxID=555315 RepID=UPI0012E3558F|nr:hypothetical protein [Ensifer canadensis]
MIFGVIAGSILLTMDIEGSEFAALHSALKTIMRSRPVMCVSLYHRPADLRAYQLDGG